MKKFFARHIGRPGIAEERIIELEGRSKDSPNRNTKRKKRGKRTEHIMQGYGTISKGTCHWDINRIRKWNKRNIQSYSDRSFRN